MQLKFTKMHPTVQTPSYATKGAACFDIRTHFSDKSIQSVAVVNSEVFETGLKFEIPENFVMLIFSRSGHAFNSDVRLANCVGVIDSDYRGELKVKLTSDGNYVTMVASGDRVAQGMIIPVSQVEFLEVGELTNTARGTSGFGSTGVV